MTAVQTPPKVQDMPLSVPDAADILTYEARMQAAMQAEQRTGPTDRWLWTRKTYYQAADAGIFGPNERLELIEGEVIRKVSPQSRPHASAIVLTAEAMRAVFHTSFHIREEKPIVLDDLSEPEPDVTVVVGTARQFDQLDRHPSPSDIALLIEVSLTTLGTDQTVKAALYARAGIVDYWLLNMPARQLEVRRDPGPLEDGAIGYRDLQIIPHDGQISPFAAPDAVINVADMLPFMQTGSTPSNAESDADNNVSNDAPAE